MSPSAPTPTRRRFLLIGGLAAASAVGAGTVFALTRTPHAAIEPWSGDALGRSDDPRLRAFARAILCPNPHNRQPWLIDFDPAADGVTRVHADPSRLLPVTDPQSRQIVIGFGCLLELLAIAARSEGLEAEIEPFPEGADPQGLDGRPIAAIRFRSGGGAAADPLAAHVLARRTVREPYDMSRPPADAALAGIVAAAAAPGLRAEATVRSDRMEAIRDLMWRAHERESLTPAAMGESIAVMRIGRAEIEANPDGVAIGGALFETLARLGLLTREAMADPESTSFQQGMEMYRGLCAATPAAFWIVSEEQGRAAEIAVGRAYLRAQLTATGLGLAFQPMSQALQEYAEMADLHAEARSLFDAPESGAVQMLARVGVAPETTPSPRWPLESRLV